METGDYIVFVFERAKSGLDGNHYDTLKTSDFIQAGCWLKEYSEMTYADGSRKHNVYLTQLVGSAP
jgi:hypothetical protein